MTLPQKPNLGHASETHPSSAQREKSGGIGTKSVLREPVKKKNVEKSTFGGGLDSGIFHISKKKVVFKMHFKPF